MCSQRQLQFLLTKIPHSRDLQKRTMTQPMSHAWRNTECSQLLINQSALQTFHLHIPFLLAIGCHTLCVQAPHMIIQPYPSPHNTSILTSTPHLHPHGKFRMCHLAMPRFQHTCKICPLLLPLLHPHPHLHLLRLRLPRNMKEVNKKNHLLCTCHKSRLDRSLNWGELINPIYMYMYENIISIN